jgi:hypothetical protein
MLLAWVRTCGVNLVMICNAVKSYVYSENISLYETNSSCCIVPNVSEPQAKCLLDGK